MLIKSLNISAPGVSITMDVSGVDLGVIRHVVDRISNLQILPMTPGGGCAITSPTTDFSVHYMTEAGTSGNFSPLNRK